MNKKVAAEVRKAHNDKYRLEHPEKIVGNHRKYHEANKEHRAEYFKKWHSNPENKKRVALNRHAYRVRLLGTGDRFTILEWNELREKYNNSCLCCGATDIPLAADHITPISKGGLNIISNIQPLCKKCNSSKRDKTIDYRPAS
jgi:5-methylcytosine-specific restriction endonuclease McrA